MSNIICGAGNCKYNSPAGFCLLDNIELSDKCECLYFETIYDTDYIPYEELLEMKGAEENEKQL